ncbi:hypothetical protein IVB51_00525 [Bradyrhizobium sp. CW10]|nr:hypothetical protein [Bradyrhizobium sp. CW10]
MPFLDFKSTAWDFFTDDYVLDALDGSDREDQPAQKRRSGFPSPVAVRITMIRSLMARLWAA